MAKFNTRTTRAAVPAGPLTATAETRTVNHEGGVGFTRDDKSDLMLLATTTIDLTADAFYEAGDARVKRFIDLIGRTATTDPQWTYQFLTWLRTKGNIRTAAVVGGVEAARAMATSGIPGGRHMVATVLRRADEPGEAIAYHHARHGRRLPMPVKRGIGDAAARLYNEYALLKYDTGSHAVRFADVLAITHPTPDPAKAHWQGPLFAYAIDRRYGRDAADGLRALDMIRRNAILREQWASDDPHFELDPNVLRDAGMTWEDAMSAVGGHVTDKADVWRNLIPTMGFMARLRNLRNFDEAGLTDADVKPVIDMLLDADQVRGSKQLPLRFLSAYRAAPSLRWAYPLEKALDVSVENIPRLPGSTLIMIDTSSSMRDPLSARSDLRRWDAATSFGLALARRCESVAVVSYSSGGFGGYGALNGYRQFNQTPGASLLKEIERWGSNGYFLGGGTDTARILKMIYGGQDRVVLLTDEQDGNYSYSGYTGTVTDAVPADRPLYTFNLAGYQTSHAATNPNRVVLGGLTDAMFGVLAAVEQRRPGNWPWVGDDSIGTLPEYPAPAGATTR